MTVPDITILRYNNISEKRRVVLEIPDRVATDALTGRGGVFQRSVNVGSVLPVIGEIGHRSIFRFRLHQDFYMLPARQRIGKNLGDQAALLNQTVRPFSPALQHRECQQPQRFLTDCKGNHRRRLDAMRMKKVFFRPGFGWQVVWIGTNYKLTAKQHVSGPGESVEFDLRWCRWDTSAGIRLDSMQPLVDF